MALSNRRTNPARTYTGPIEQPTISASDIVRSRERWRKYAPRRYWGLVDCPRTLTIAEVVSRQHGGGGSAITG